MDWLFWLSFALLFYTFVGYPLLLWPWAALFGKPVKKADRRPPLSILISVYNEEKGIRGKVAALLAQAYEGTFEILIGSDGSDDGTEAVLAELASDASDAVRPFVFRERQGKAETLNRLAEEAEGEILVFCDVRQELEADALRQLASNFSDPSIGCVSGELLLTNGDGSGVGSGIGVYWKYEKYMRKKESAIHSTVGATGALYAVRKELFVPSPRDTLVEDVLIPMRVVSQGYRSVLDPDARAYDEVVTESDREFRRKIRTLAGNFQLLFKHPGLLNPFKQRNALQFFSHKVLRVFAFLFLITLFVSSALLPQPGFRVFFVLQAAFYALALLGFLMERGGKTPKFLGLPYMFCVLNFSALYGLVRYLRGRQKVTWKS